MGEGWTEQPYAEQVVGVFKLAEIAMCAVLGSVEDERTFSSLGFMKSKVRNRLGGHLNAVVKMFSQPFYTQADSPYAAAITHWRETRQRLGAGL